MTKYDSQFNINEAFENFKNKQELKVVTRKSNLNINKTVDNRGGSMLGRGNNDNSESNGCKTGIKIQKKYGRI
jgi:hypothetical protein